LIAFINPRRPRDPRPGWVPRGLGCFPLLVSPLAAALPDFGRRGRRRRVRPALLRTASLNHRSSTASSARRVGWGSVQLFNNAPGQFQLRLAWLFNAADTRGRCDPRWPSPLRVLRCSARRYRHTSHASVDRPPSRDFPARSPNRLGCVQGVMAGPNGRVELPPRPPEPPRIADLGRTGASATVCLRVH